MADPRSEQERAREYYELSTLVEAGRRWRRELQHQITRLEGPVVGRTQEEKEYFDRLRVGYTTAARYTSVLLNYHKGRLAKLAEGEEPSEEMPSSILDDGRVAPVFEEDER